MIEIENLSKTYDGGFQALTDINLDIAKGEIFALLGPNGAGKTTLISVICGIVTASSGAVRVGGHNIEADFRQARKLIGLVPQEIPNMAFEKVIDTVAFSRGLFGLAPDPAKIEQILRDLSLWDKRDGRLRTLSGGMKRRHLIAKALAHEPAVLFLDEPTAGVDVELRQDMWALVRRLRERGTTIILTTHYIEEAEEMADRVGVINDGKIILVEDKAKLMQKLGQKSLTLHLHDALGEIPSSLSDYDLTLSDDRLQLHYTYDTRAERTGITSLLRDVGAAGITFQDLQTSQKSLEDIFVSLVTKSSKVSA